MAIWSHVHIPETTAETLAEQSEGNDHMTTSESVESAGEEMDEEVKHSNETEGNTEADAADLNI